MIITKRTIASPSIEIKEFKQSHDRFLIIENKTVYHFEALLKAISKNSSTYGSLDTSPPRNWISAYFLCLQDWKR